MKKKTNQKYTKLIVKTVTNFKYNKPNGGSKTNL